MISNQILQNTIEGIKTISRMELCVVDIDGREVRINPLQRLDVGKEVVVVAYIDQHYLELFVVLRKHRHERGVEIVRVFGKERNHQRDGGLLVTSLLAVGEAERRYASV